MTQEACAKKQEEVVLNKDRTPLLRRLADFGDLCWRPWCVVGILQRTTPRLHSYLVLTGSAVRVMVAGNIL